MVGGRSGRGCPPSGEHGAEKAHLGVIPTGIRRWRRKPACKGRQEDPLMMVGCGRAGDMFIKGGPSWQNLLKMCSLLHSTITALSIKFSYRYHNGNRHKTPGIQKAGTSYRGYFAFRGTGGGGLSRKPSDAAASNTDGGSLKSPEFAKALTAGGAVL